MRPARAVALGLAPLLLAACSVSTPRNGFTAAGRAEAARQGVATAEAGADGALVTEEGGATASAGGGGGASGTGRATASAGRAGGAGGSASGAARGAGASAVGVTKDTITISVIGGFGGAYGTVFEQTYREGFETWLKDVNANGGIHGRQVLVKKVDHGEAADKGVAACREARTNGSFTTFIVEGTGEGNYAAADCLDKAGVTNVAFAGAPSPTWKHVYGFAASSVEQGASLASFVRNKMGDGGKKLGVLHLTQPAYVAAKDAYVREAKNLGLDIVATEAVEANQASFTPQLLRLKNKGVENVAAIVTIEAIGILRDAQALDYRPHWTGMGWLFDFISQAARNTADGVQGLAFSATVNSPAYAAFRQKQQQYGTTGSGISTSMVLYGTGLLAGRVLDAAGPSPTQASLVAGLHSIRGYDNGIQPPITYTPEDHAGTHDSFPAICCNPDYTWRGSGPPARKF
jgi:ABC-type branched-subunit amino acid transport system substrate-binding protein